MAGGLLFVAIALQFWLVTPILESDGSYEHYGYVRWLAAHHSLPVARPPVYPHDPAKEHQIESYGIEGGQAPLYYLLAALMTAPIPGHDNVDQVAIFNPAAGTGFDGVNQNDYMHRPFSGFPTGAELALRLIGLLGIVCGAITAISAVLLARLYVPKWPAVWLAAPAAIAANTAFDYHAPAVSNDALVTALASVSVLAMACWLKRPGSRWSWISGLLIAPAVLAKFNAIGLAACYLYCAWVTGDSIRRRALALAPLAVTVGLIDGWWFVRNVVLYGDPTALSPLNHGSVRGAINAGRLRAFLQPFGRSLHTFLSGWGSYGNIDSQAVFGITAVLAVVGLIAGLTLGVARRHEPLAGLLILWPALLVLELAYYSYASASDHDGRLMFPGIAALAVLVASGWAQLLRLLRAGVLGWGLACGALAVPVVVAWGIIAPDFAYPQRLQALPASASPVHARFGDVKLLGVESSAGEWVDPRQPVKLALYWRAAQPISELLSTYVHVDSNDPNYVAGWKYEGPSGGGRYPPNYWQPGEIVVDRYTLQLNPDTRSDRRNAVRLSVRAGMYGPPRFPGDPPRKLDSDPPAAKDSGFEVAAFKLPGEQPSRAVVPTPLAAFDSGIDLVDGRVQQIEPGVLAVDLRWQARAKPAKDFTIFVQLLSNDGQLLAQSDSYPLAGRYPTSQWSAGENVFDRVQLTLTQPLRPEDHVIAGMYALPSVERARTQAGATYVAVR